MSAEEILEDCGLLSLTYLRKLTAPAVAEAAQKIIDSGIVRDSDGNAQLNAEGWEQLKVIAAFKNPVVLAECAWLLVALSANKSTFDKLQVTL